MGLSAYAVIYFIILKNSSAIGSCLFYNYKWIYWIHDWKRLYRHWPILISPSLHWPILISPNYNTVVSATLLNCSSRSSYALKFPPGVKGSKAPISPAIFYFFLCWYQKLADYFTGNFYTTIWTFLLLLKKLMGSQN